MFLQNVLFCLIIKRICFMGFLEKWAEFPLFLDAPDNTSCRYFLKFNNLQQCIRI
ncbi:hypothetical protein Hanom_Chr04g00333121 [Helianthus anomalus]